LELRGISTLPYPLPRLLHKIFIQLELGAYLDWTLVTNIFIALGLTFGVMQNIHSIGVAQKSGKEKAKAPEFGSGAFAFSIYFKDNRLSIVIRQAIFPLLSVT
jgi:hypothetical protein